MPLAFVFDWASKAPPLLSFKHFLILYTWQSLTLHWRSSYFYPLCVCLFLQFWNDEKHHQEKIWFYLPALGEIETTSHFLKKLVNFFGSVRSSRRNLSVCCLEYWIFIVLGQIFNWQFSQLLLTHTSDRRSLIYELLKYI